MRIFTALLFILALTACDPAGNRGGEGPVLLQDVTLTPISAVTVRDLSPTPSPVLIPIITSTTLPTALVLGETTAVPSLTSAPAVIIQSESTLLIPTRAAQATLITPTQPPSKTPTITPTQTQLPTFTSLPPTAPPATFTPYIIAPPTVSVVVQPPVQATIGVVPLPTVAQAQPCGVSWFFTSTFPGTCPTNPAVSSPGAFQQFQKGLMLWIGQQNAIYVLYDSANYPRWQVFPDLFKDGIPETDPNYNNAPSGTYQPRRGFGLVWRSQTGVIDRLGWAVNTEEMGYQPLAQVGADGTIFISDPRGGVFSLSPSGADWKRYE
jgi:hypothetical protein